MLSPGERKGLTVLVTVAGLSVVSVALLLGSLLTRDQDIRPAGLFFLLLLFWELIQGIASFMSVRWTHLGSVEMDEFCVVQGLVKQFNGSGSALATIGLSWCILHNYVFQARDIPLRRAVGVLVAMSIVQILVVLIPNIKVGVNKLNAPSGFWCYIPEGHFYALKIVTTYFFYWTAAGFSFLTALAYFASAWVDRRLPCGHFWIGFFTRNNGLLRMGFFSELTADEREPTLGFTFDILWFGSNKSIVFVQYLSPPPPVLMPLVPIPPIPIANGNVNAPNAAPLNIAHGQVDQNRMVDAMMLLSFPLSYACLVVPLSIVRFITFNGHHVGSAATIFVGTWFALTGLVVVVLFVLLQPDFGLRVPRILEARQRPIDREGPNNT